MAEHTPGPWSLPHFVEADELGGCQCGYIYSESQSGMGAICHIGFDGEDEPRLIAAANARLIAAAPELLAACKQLADFAERQGWFHVAINDARAAIAKATEASS